MRLPVLLFSLALSAAATAQSLTGHIVDYNGAPVFNVNVILSNGAPLGTTDINGDFTITGLRNRTYTIDLDPHTNFLAAQEFDFTVNGAANLGTVVLGPAVPVSATFVGPNGLGLLGVNMNAYVAGVKLYTPHDGSDALGNVVIGVPTGGPVTIRAVPPVGSNLVPWETVMTPTAPVALGTRTLRAGFTVTGTLVDQVNLLGAGNCELITTDMLTGEVVPQLAKLSLATGAFTLLLPFGLHQIDIVPPLTAPLHAGKQILGLPVLSNVALGLVRLQQGAALSGTVLGPGGVPVGGADIDIYTTTEDKLFTPHDNTAANGAFSVIVPFGATTSYSVRVDPLAATGLVGVRTGYSPFPGASSVGTINLQAGVHFDLTVLGYNGLPVAGANLNLLDPTTGAELITPGDISDASGHLVANVPTGTWNLHLQSPQGNPSLSLSQSGVVIAGPVTTTVNLPAKSLAIDAHGLGILTIAPGGQVFMNFSFFNLTTGTITATVEGVIRTPDGTEYPWVPQLQLDFPGLFGTGIDLWIPTPVLPASARGRILRGIARVRDLGGNLLDEAYVQFVAAP